MPLLEQVLNNNKDKVKIAYKYLPLTNIHKMALPAAIAAQAAENQGMFWEFHDRLYKVKKINQTTFDLIANELKMDIEQFNKDRVSQDIRNIINQDIQEAVRIGVSSTPTIYINGKKLKQRSLSGFQMMIDQELSTTNQ